MSSGQRTDIDRLEERVRQLESRGTSAPAPSLSRAKLSDSYLHARRSVRFWPVEGDTDEAIRKGVGDFIHDTLMVNTSDVGQDDIEEVRRINDSAPMGAGDRREVVVTFFDRRKRDAVVANSVNLASWTDPAGKPTAGIRLEIPRELEDTFRLLSRFGTRLRARHGVGTKRHIKFDDFSGTLYSNVKLPGDESWTRVTPEMARDDLQASVNEENTATKKRLAAKLVPISGPKERLSRPVPPSRVATSRNGVNEASTSNTSAPPSGKRPRWSIPDRRRPV